MTVVLEYLDVLLLAVWEKENFYSLILHYWNSPIILVIIPDSFSYLLFPKLFEHILLGPITESLHIILTSVVIILDTQIWFKRNIHCLRNRSQALILYLQGDWTTNASFNENTKSINIWYSTILMHRQMNHCSFPYISNPYTQFDLQNIY